MSQGKTFRLIVQVSDTCIELLRYLDKNISSVNVLGAKVQVEKISKQEFDEDMVETLRKKGITRLPALIAPDGKLFIGLKKIMDLFEKNLNNVRNDARTSAIGGYGGPADDAEMGSNPDLTDFWSRELFAGQDRKGRPIPRKDKDEGDDEGAVDYERRMAEYRRKEPKHRRSGGERDIDPAPRETGRRKKYDDEPEDNVASDDESDGGYDEPAPRRGGKERAQPRLAPTGDARGDDLDARMMAAWLNNNPQDS